MKHRFILCVNAVSRAGLQPLKRLLQIGPRAERHPTLRLTHALTPSVEAAYIMPARGPQYFLSVGLVASKNQNELWGF